MEVKKDFIGQIETLLNAGVYVICNRTAKEVWVSYTNNFLEALVRNIPKINKKHFRFKESLHADQVSLDFYPVASNMSREELRYKFHEECAKWATEGYKLLNKNIKYKLKGEIKKDFRLLNDPTKSAFLYYVWLCTLNRKVRLVGIFTNTMKGKKFMDSFQEVPTKAEQNESDPDYPLWQDYINNIDRIEYEVFLNGR